MVLGGHHHVLLSGSFGETRKGTRRIRLWLEQLGKLHVLLDWDCLVFHGPLMPAMHAVQTPMDEHAELSCVPPLHTLLAIGGDRCRLADRRLLLVFRGGGLSRRCSLCSGCSLAAHRGCRN